MWNDNATDRAWDYYEKHGSRRQNYQRILYPPTPSLWQRIGPFLTWTAVLGSWLVICAICIAWLTS